MRRFKDFWHETPRSIQLTCCFLVPLGFACGTLGIYGDCHGWWEDRSFLANLTSSFTGLLVGLPMALAVVSHLGNAQTEALERRSVKRQSVRALSDFRRAVISGFTEAHRGDVPTGLMELVRIAVAIEDETLGGPPGSDDQARAAVRVAVTASRQFRDKCSDLFEFWHEPSGPEDSWPGLAASHWNALNDELRPRAIGAGLSWITAQDSYDIAKLVKGIGPTDWGLDQARRIESMEAATGGALWSDFDVHSGIVGDLHMLGEHTRQAREWVMSLRDLVGALDHVRTLESNYQ